MSKAPTQDELNAFKNRMESAGWFLFEDVVDETLVGQLIVDLERSYDVRRKIQIKNGVDADTEGTAHHVLADGGSFLELLGRAYIHEYLKTLFGGQYILNAFGGNLNRSGQRTYASNVHRDVRTYTRELRLLVNTIVMLDDFTLTNGATHLLAGSHLDKSKPSDEVFFKTADRAVGRRGSIVVWDSNVWHAAGVNHSGHPRRSLSILYSQPFMKQQLDYPRAIGYDQRETLTEQCQQIVGFRARVPATLDEWYQPPDQRFYKGDQG